MSIQGIRDTFSVFRDVVRFISENPQLVQDFREVLQHIRNLIALFRQPVQAVQAGETVDTR